MLPSDFCALYEGGAGGILASTAAAMGPLAFLENINEFLGDFANPGTGFFRGDNSSSDIVMFSSRCNVKKAL
jgi:hypothetical protein